MNEKIKNPIDFSKINVIINFPGGDYEVVPFNEIREYALSIEDLNMCSTLLEDGSVQVGSLIFEVEKLSDGN